MDESRLWLVFTVVCIASIIGLLEYEDKIDIFGEKIPRKMKLILIPQMRCMI